MFDMSYGIHRIKNSQIEMIYFCFDTYILVDKLEVVEEFRNKGIGSKFMQSFLNQVDKDVVLKVLYHQPIPFYERLGFVIEAVYDVLDDGRVSYCDMCYNYNKEKRVTDEQFKKDIYINKISSTSDKYGNKLVDMMNEYNVINLKDLSLEQVERFYKKIKGE